MRFLELRRHTDNDGDKLTELGVARAEEIARTSLHPPYSHFFSTGTWRTGEMVTILRKAAKQTSSPLIDEPTLRSMTERRWRLAAKAAGEGASIEDVRLIDPELVEEETATLSVALRTIFSRLRDGDRGLAVGHGLTNEAAVYGLTGVVVPPLGFGEGVLLTQHDDGHFEVSLLPR